MNTLILYETKIDGKKKKKMLTKSLYSLMKMLL